MSYFGNKNMKGYFTVTIILVISFLFLSTGGGTVQFNSDDECTDFVHLFFPHCRQHIPSCSKVQNDQVKA